MLSAGLAFAWSGIATKLASDDLYTGHTFTGRAVGALDAARLDRRVC